MLVPLYGFMHGDTLGLIVLVHDHHPVRQIVACLQEAASVRAPSLRRPRVLFNGTALDPDMTIAAAGLTPLDRVDVVPEEEA